MSLSGESNLRPSAYHQAKPAHNDDTMQQFMKRIPTPATFYGVPSIP